MLVDPLSTEDLERQVRALAEADSPSKVFKLLLESSVLASPRTAMFLVRQGQVKGWGSIGFEREAMQRQRTFAADGSEGRLGRVIAGRHSDLLSGSEIPSDPDFGQPRPTDSLAIPVSVKQRPIAVMLAERSDEGEGPWYPAAMSLLVQVAQLRLDLDLTLRKLQSAKPETAEGRGVASGPQQTQPAEGAAGPASTTPPAAETEVLEAARRFARLVATDIRLYNEEAVASGRRDGDLLTRLEDHLDRGKETFLKRHGDLGPTALEILREAYVDVLAGGDGTLIPASSMH